jgi:HEAT repeat protein
LQKMVTAGLAIAIGDSESYVRWRVAAALGQIGTEEAVAGLVRLLGDETSGVRQNAVKSLGQIGSTGCSFGSGSSFKPGIGGRSRAGSPILARCQH